MRIKSVIVVFLFVLAQHAAAQVVSLKDSAQVYNNSRIKINSTGMKVLGTWGLINIAVGGTGYFVAKSDEGRFFSEMNVLWGVVNTGIAFMGMAGVKKEMAAHMSVSQQYGRYLQNKRLYLINAGLDVLYIGTGVALNEYGVNATHNGPLYKGFGKSVAVQGIFLLLFDNIMFASHQRYNSRWFQLINEIRITNNGIGINYTF